MLAVFSARTCLAGLSVASALGASACSHTAVNSGDRPTNEPPAAAKVRFVFDEIPAAVLDEQQRNGPVFRARLGVTAPGGTERLVDLGEVEGDCDEARYVTYERPSPRPADTVLGTVCYMGGATILVVVRDGDAFVVHQATQGDGAIEDEKGEMTAQPMSPWKELARVRP